MSTSGERTATSTPRMTGRIDRERQKNIGVAEHVVVEEVLHAGAEVGDARDPVAEGNGDTILLLDVALALQRKEGHSLAGGVLQQRAGDGIERRRLVIVGISGA